MLEGKKETRGRKADPEIKYAPEKETKIYIDPDGVKRIWIYDRSITKNGPISCETIYPGKGFNAPLVEDDLDIIKVQKEGVKISKSGKVFLTKQKYLNPNSGKMVGYMRYKELIKQGLIKK